MLMQLFREYLLAKLITNSNDVRGQMDCLPTNLMDDFMKVYHISRHFYLWLVVLNVRNVKSQTDGIYFLRKESLRNALWNLVSRKIWWEHFVLLSAFLIITDLFQHNLTKHRVIIKNEQKINLWVDGQRSTNILICNKWFNRW